MVDFLVMEDPHANNICTYCDRSYDDSQFNQQYLLAVDIFNEELSRIVNAQINYFDDSTSFVLSNVVIKKILLLLYKLNYPNISSLDSTKQQLFIFHLFISILNQYNKNNNLTILTSVIIPTALLTLSNYLSLIKKLLHSLITKSVSAFKNSNSDTIDIFKLLYKADLDFIKSDITYYFLEHVLLDNDPLVISDIDDFFYVIINGFIINYFNSRVSDLVNNVNSNDLSNYIYRRNDDRFSIYNNGLYFSKLLKISKSSPSFNIAVNNYKKLTDSVLDNPVQKLLFLLIGDNNNSSHEKIYFDTYVLTSNLKEIKLKFPTIYKLSRCVRIKSDLQLLSSEHIVLLKHKLNIFLNKFCNRRNLKTDNLSFLIDHTCMNLINQFNNSSFIDLIKMNTFLFTPTKLIDELVLFFNYILITLDQ